MSCPFSFTVCSKDLPCYQCLKEQLEEANLVIRESNADADALIRLSKGLDERFPRGKRPNWALPSNCDTALLYIDKLCSEVAALRGAIECLIMIKCGNPDCQATKARVRSLLEGYRNEHRTI